MLRAIGVDLQGDPLSFPRHLAEFREAMSDAKFVCFHFVRMTEEKTLRLF
jgi:hypothetical protein